MKLIFKDPARPQDLFSIGGRTDGDPIVSEGETFEVDDARGRELLAHYYPRLQPVDEPKEVFAPAAEPVTGLTSTDDAAVFVKDDTEFLG